MELAGDLVAFATMATNQTNPGSYVDQFVWKAVVQAAFVVLQACVPAKMG